MRHSSCPLSSAQFNSPFSTPLGLIAPRSSLPSPSYLPYYDAIRRAANCNSTPSAITNRHLPPARNDITVDITASSSFHLMLPSIRLSIHPSIQPTTHPSIYPSIHLLFFFPLLLLLLPFSFQRTPIPPFSSSISVHVIYTDIPPCRRPLQSTVRLLFHF